jgi:hypothetical protein
MLPGGGMAYQAAEIQPAATGQHHLAYQYIGESFRQKMPGLIQRTGTTQDKASTKCLPHLIAYIIIAID